MNKNTAGPDYPSDFSGDRYTAATSEVPARLPAVHRWQILYLLLGDVEPDPVIDPGHGADRDGDFLASPQVPLREQHMGHPPIPRADVEALHPADLTVDGMDRVPGPHLYLTQRDDVLEDH